MSRADTCLSSGGLLAGGLDWKPLSLTPKDMDLVGAILRIDAAGYDPVSGGDELKFAHADRLAKFNPDQPRVPAGNSGGGQWTNADGSQDAGDGSRVSKP